MAGRPKKVPVEGQEKRNKGRPFKDEIVVKPVVVHDFDKIKPENVEGYANKAVENANRIFRKYNEQRPNPLNIDLKDLSDEAKEAWKYIFHTREYEGVDYSNRALESAEETVYLFEAFCSYIRKEGFTQVVQGRGEERIIPLVPNQTSFSRWLGISRSSISRTMNAPEAEHERQMYKGILSDLISEGAMMGAYQQSMAIFSLKNMCDWADRYDERPHVNTETHQTLEEAQALIDSLGYKRLTDG